MSNYPDQSDSDDGLGIVHNPIIDSTHLISLLMTHLALEITIASTDTDITVIVIVEKMSNM